MENNDKPIIPLTPEMTIPAYRSEVLDNIFTSLLNRNVAVEILTPPDMDRSKKYPLLVLNDGQDMAAVKVKETVERMVAEKLIPPIIVVGIVAADRLQEYGGGLLPLPMEQKWLQLTWVAISTPPPTAALPGRSVPVQGYIHGRPLPHRLTV
jgi:enterochelin esterase-like enzyme